MGLGASREKARLSAELEARNAEFAALKARMDALDVLKEKELNKDILMEDVRDFEKPFNEPQVIPFANQALLGSTLGWASGFTLRTLGKAAGLAVGTSFMMLQGLSYLGYVNVDW